MNKIIIGAVLGIAAVWLLVYIITPQSLPNLGGNITAQFSSATNSSSTISTNGEVIITSANNPRGIYFSVTNSGNVPFFCGLTTNTSTLTRAGRLMSVSSTGQNSWELSGYNGPISCLSPSGTGEVNFIYR